MMATVRGVRSFRAMGCRSTVVVEGIGVDCERLAEVAMTRVARLEACWSRFLPDSDVSRINGAGGSPIAVRPATMTLIQAMADAWRATGGAFDPTVPHRSAQGDDFGDWVDRVWIDAGTASVGVADLQLDPGGIGKGLAADLVAAAAVADGASAAVVSLGGDVRVSSPAGRRHVVEIAAPTGDGAAIDRIVVGEGAVATSGTRRGDLVDPATGVLADGRVVQASVLAPTGASAEAHATEVMVRGEGVLGRLDAAGIGVLAVRDDGSLALNETWRRHRLPDDEHRCERASASERVATRGLRGRGTP